VPRPPVQLSGDLNNITITGRDDTSIDITKPMRQYCQQRPPQLNSIQAYIFKSKSPSCGINNIPVFNSQGQSIGTSMGVFAHAILQQYPDLPITDEQGLLSLKQRNDFLQEVLLYGQTPK